MPFLCKCHSNSLQPCPLISNATPISALVFGMTVSILPSLNITLILPKLNALSYPQSGVATTHSELIFVSSMRSIIFGNPIASNKSFTSEKSFLLNCCTTLIVFFDLDLNVCDGATSKLYGKTNRTQSNTVDCFPRFIVIQINLLYFLHSQACSPRY